MGYIPRWWHVPQAWYQAKDSSPLNGLRYRIASHLSWFTYRLQSFYLDHAPKRSLGLPYDGESFSDDTAVELLERMKSLRAAGYHVPEYALDKVREEIAEETEQGASR